MALFGAPTPEETVKARKAALSDFTDIAQPALASQQKYERDKLKMDMMQNAQAPVPTPGGAVPSKGLQALGTLGMLQKGESAGAQLIPQQGAQQDKLNLQGAIAQQDIANSKTAQATTNTVQMLENDTQKYARLVADRAFAAGMEAKQLVFSENNALSDYAFEAMRNDFASGRVSQKEIRDLGNKFAIDAKKKKQTADEALKFAQEDFLTDMRAGNVERAKSRILYANAKYKEALEAAAKAQATAMVAEGIIGAAGAVADDYFGTGGLISGIAEGLGKMGKGVFG